MRITFILDPHASHPTVMTGMRFASSSRVDQWLHGDESHLDLITKDGVRVLLNPFYISWEAEIDDPLPEYDWCAGRRP